MGSALQRYDSRPTPFDSAKMKRYVKLAGRDITRKDPSKCAAYLKLELSSKQESALLQLRTGGSLLATDAEGVRLAYGTRSPMRCVP